MLIKAVKECKNEKTDNPEIPGYRSFRVNFFIDLYKSLKELQGLFIHFIIGIPKASSANIPGPQKLF